MALLEVTDLKFKYADKELYNEASFRLLNGEHICLLGTNGCGKSTFMNLIAKNLIPDSGKIEWLPNTTFSYLDQQLKVKEDVSIEEYLMQVFAPLYAKEKEMNKYFDMLTSVNENEYDKILNRALEIQDYLEEKNFYAINSTVGNITNGLGITGYGMATPLKKLSGGQREKVYLAKMLLEGNDVLLMDEPTNFLDISHIDWLSKYLVAYKKAFIVISHDIEFVKIIGNVIYELENKNFIRYKGNYDYYVAERELRHLQYQQAYNNQQKYIKQTEAFIDKNIVRATSSKAAKSRRKALEKITVLDKPQGEVKIHINFPYSKNLGAEVLKFKDLVVGYNNKAILPPLNYLIKHNQKVAILGRNGVGKTTILKTLLGLLEPISGSFTFNPSADINYFSQEEKYEDITPIQFLRGYYPLKTDGELRTVLAALGINKDLVLKSMTELSGGEQTRVRLSLMTMKKSNLLIFDEPTNHLDRHTKEVLYDSIKNFEGSVILVSHEKDFYDDLVDLMIDFD